MPRNIFYVFLAFGLAIAGGSAFYYASAWLRASEGRGWPTTQGTILSVDVEDRVGGDSDGHNSYTYYPRIAYSYRVGARALRGERIWLTGNAFFNDRADAVAFVQDYQPGQSVPVAYDPEHPGQAALLVENPPWQILLFTAFGLVWTGLSLGFRRRGRGKPRERFGVCRVCGARLPFAKHARTLVPGDPATPGAGADGHACTRCGERDPLNSIRNKPVLIVFWVAFASIWLVGLYLVFLA
jgi:hypothetical protein